MENKSKNLIVQDEIPNEEIKTSKVNQAVKRNIERFSERFCFRLSKSEFDILMSQIVTSLLFKPKFKNVA